MDSNSKGKSQSEDSLQNFEEALNLNKLIKKLRRDQPGGGRAMGSLYLVILA